MLVAASTMALPAAALCAALCARSSPLCARFRLVRALVEAAAFVHDLELAAS